MTPVIDQDWEQIGTHVLVIGVGHYPHLLEGESPLFDYHGGMGQLSSPPNSALELANWFATNHKHPGKPLRTMQLLISGTPNTFTTPAGQEIPIKPATMENIRQAVKLWRDLGNLHEENHLVFYFCGHGVSNGFHQSLLSQDFGSDKDDPFIHAVDFQRLHAGMRVNCRAKRQCYFLDACQTISQDYLERFGNESSGVAIIAGPLKSNLRKTWQPIIMACALDAKAYGEEAKASFFAQSLLDAFKGAAAKDNGYGEWEINTAQLCDGINAFLVRRLKRGFGMDQAADPGTLAIPFTLHVLDGEPIVPVDIFCGDDPDKTKDLAFDCLIGETVMHSCPGGGKRVWEIDLPKNTYDFRVTNITGGPSPPPRTGVTIIPPYIEVKLKCP